MYQLNIHIFIYKYIIHIFTYLAESVDSAQARKLVQAPKQYVLILFCFWKLLPSWHCKMDKNILGRWMRKPHTTGSAVPRETWGIRCNFVWNPPSRMCFLPMRASFYNEMIGCATTASTLNCLTFPPAPPKHVFAHLAISKTPEIQKKTKQSISLIKTRCFLELGQATHLER